MGGSEASNEVGRQAGVKERRFHGEGKNKKVERGGRVGGGERDVLNCSNRDKRDQDGVQGLQTTTTTCPPTHFSCASTFLRLSSVSRI